MDFNSDDVVEIMRILKESNFSELNLEVGDFRLALNKYKKTPFTDNRSDNLTNNYNKTTSHESNIDQLEKSCDESELIDMEKNSPHLQEENGLTAIKAPMLGVFYRSSEPGGPPFVVEGSEVDEKTTICIIEVMKLFSSIPAGQKGRIVKVCAEDGQLVEYQQTLFLISNESS